MLSSARSATPGVDGRSAGFRDGCDTGIEAGIEADAGASFLHKLWRAAPSAGSGMPLFEDVAIGSLGRLADHVGLVASTGADSFRIMHAGVQFEAWLDQPARGLDVAGMRPDCRRAFLDVIQRALVTCRPGRGVANVVRDGSVVFYDLMVLPLHNRWGRPLLMTYVRQREGLLSLVEALFRVTAEGMIALSIVRDAGGEPADFQIVAMNGAVETLIRRPLAALQWQRLSDLDLEGWSDAVERLREVARTGGRDHFEVEAAIGGSGDTQYFGVSAASMGDLIAVTLTDIGDLKRREASFRLLFEGNPVPMWVFSPETLRFVAVNDAAAAHYGYGRDVFLGMSLPEIWPEAERDRLKLAVASGREIDGTEKPWRHLKADGCEIEVLGYMRSLTYNARPVRLMAMIDVTEKRRAEKRISHMAHHDALTDLPNRVLFRSRLDEALARIDRRREMVAVHCLDLDHFKMVNDTLGHPVGDLLLQEVAVRLRSALREEDVIARLGGDEFAVIQAGIEGPEDAAAFGARMVDVLGRPYEIDGHQVVTGASIGIALAPGDAREADPLLKNADMALYRAKEDGRRTFRFFEAAMDARMQARRVMELDLRKALAAGEFELYYQPQVAVDSGEVTGFEALLRWHHPQLGMIPPGDFIPLAEEIGLIVPMGEWVLRQACAEAAAWPQHLRISVNLSPCQFRSRNLLPAVVSALASSGLTPSRLELEITETVLLSQSEANIATLHQLRNLGVRISMDDFGTGYSSLSYLRAFPFDRIKIDRSFVHELAESNDCMAIVRAVTGLGASLGISTTAEGVETQEQLHRLREEGCSEVQGYLFSPPRPAAEIPGLLSRIASMRA